MGKKRKRHVLTLPKTKFHAKNQKNLSRGFPGKLSETERERERQTDRQRETDPNIRVLRTLSLSRRTKKNQEEGQQRDIKEGQQRDIKVQCKLCKKKMLPKNLNEHLRTIL